MVFNLSIQPSLATIFLNELRDKSIQKDSMRFRENLKRITQILCYEMSRKIGYQTITVETPLGELESNGISDKLVIGSILRAGLPMHEAALSYFDRAESAFVSAYRKYHKSGEFEIRLEYSSAPDLNNKVLILCDPMLATGSSIIATLRDLQRFGTCRSVIILAIIASQDAIDSILSEFPSVFIFTAAVDMELTGKGYIVPGLGDAGDLAYGQKMDF